MRVAPPAVPSADRAACARLHGALPARLESLHGRPTLPASALTAAWGSPAVVLRCGVPVPTAGGTALRVNGVTWLQVVGRDAVTWTTLDRRPAVQLRVPRSYPAQGAYLVDLAGPVTRALPQVPPPG